MTSPIKPTMWPVGDLIPYELNAKKHDKAQVAKIAASINKFGWTQSIVVDKDGVIIIGHGRRLAAIELGLAHAQVIQRNDLSADQVKALRLADNRVAISDIDPELLRMELSGLEEDMTSFFDEKELDFMGADLGSMDEGAFVTDMGAVLADQKADIDDRTEKAAGAGARIPVAKAFGFKDISAAGRLAITNLMSKAEAATGLKNDQALVAWAGMLV